MSGEIVPRTVDAILAEIGQSPNTGRPAKTIFFGGGTPTFLDARDQARILDAVVRAHPPQKNCEITTEANPGTVDAAKFRDLKGAGFNRLSIGAQSFDADELRVLDRVHSPEEVVRAVDDARTAGFDNISIDLMFALPHQSMTRWKRNLERAFALETEHLSLYCLTVEPATKFYKLHLQGSLHQPDDEVQAAMYDETVMAARTAGFERYEISNFAKPGKQCEHNLCYWRGEEYVGYGPGAVERVGSKRRTNMKHPVLYCETIEIGTELACESEILDQKALMTEKIMLGLRLSEGVDPNELDMGVVARLVSKGWLSISGRVRLTDIGAHYCNQVILELI
jgi:oxygen-independent coproporphyrinogen-3 oxidase